MGRASGFVSTSFMIIETPFRIFYRWSDKCAATAMPTMAITSPSCVAPLPELPANE